MTVDVDNPRRLEFVGNGSDVNYPYDFLIFQDTDLNVFIDGNLQVVNADYTVTGINQQGGGNVVFTVAPLDQSGIIIDSNVPATQTVDFEVGGKFKPDTVNFVNDKLTVIDQQIKTLLKQRGLLYPETSFLDSGGKDNVLPPLGAQLDKEIPIWSKNKDNTIIATFLEEAGDLSNLRAELEDESESSPGTGLIGYYDEFDCTAPVGKTLDVLLKQIAPLIDCRIAAVNAQDPTKRVRFDLSDIPTNTTVDFKFHGNTPAGGVPTGGMIIWGSNNIPDGWLLCDGRDIDVLSDTAPSYGQDLFNAIEDLWGKGSETYVAIPNTGAVRPVVAASVGTVSTPPDPGSTGFTFNVTQAGDNTNNETVEITCVAGNAVPAGSFFKLYSPVNNRETVVWYKVDGSGTAPSAPGSLIFQLDISSTDTAEQVAIKTQDFWKTQIKIPDLRGVFLRGLVSGDNTDQRYAVNPTNVFSPGSGYSVNDIITIDAPYSQLPPTIKVTSIGGGGAVTNVEVENRGRFSQDPGAGDYPTIGGTGSGCRLELNTETFDPEFANRLSYPWTSNENTAKPDAVIGAKISSYQQNEVQSHDHPLSDVPRNVAGSGVSSGSEQPIFPNSGVDKTGFSGGVETRPVNVAVNYIIKT